MLQANHELFEMLFQQKMSPAQDNFLLLKLKQRIKAESWPTLEQLFFQYLPASGEDRWELTELFLRQLIDDIYLELISYLNFLELKIKEHKTATASPASIKLCTKVKLLLRDVLIEGMHSRKIPIPGQKRIEQALTKVSASLGLIKHPECLHGFSVGEIICNLQKYLTEATALADMAEMMDIYFTGQEITPILAHLENQIFNPFTEKYLAGILTDQRLQQINNHLIKTSMKHPLPDIRKQAYALFLSLKMKIVPASKHPFIRRLLANSFLEYKLKQTINKE